MKLRKLFWLGLLGCLVGQPAVAQMGIHYPVQAELLRQERGEWQQIQADWRMMQELEMLRQLQKRRDQLRRPGVR
jgi:hypothetical protein